MNQKPNKKSRKSKKEKIQNIEEIAKGESADEIDDVRAMCLQNHQLYLENIELGKQVATIIESDAVINESLGKINKEAFNTYRK